jgi:hypothetical protein
MEWDDRGTGGWYKKLVNIKDGSMREHEKSCS